MRALPTFWKHMLTVLGGSVAAQALPIMAAPLITRLCRPEDMGAFSVWFGLVAIAAVAATLRMENAMVIDHQPEPQRLCFDVVAWSAGWLALLITGFALAAKLAGASLAAQSGWHGMSWLGVLSLGLGAWLTATMQITLAYAASHNAFAPAAKARVWAAGSIALLQLLLLALGVGAGALLAGHLLGLAAGLAAARRLLKPPHSHTGLALSQPQRQYLKKHQAFWRYTLPANLLNAGVGQLPLLIIGARHGALAAGLFALTQRVLAAPISLLAASVLEVFKRESVLQFQTLGNCRQAYLHALRVLLLLGCGPSLLLLLASPALFSFVFGPAWRGAGELAQILAPLYFLNFVASPLSYVFAVAGRQKVELLWQVALFCMTVTVFAAPLTLRDSVLAYTIGYSLLYLLYLQMSYRYALNRGAPGRLHAAN